MGPGGKAKQKGREAKRNLFLNDASACGTTKDVSQQYSKFKDPGLSALLHKFFLNHSG